jgi:hypothetical protein
MVFLTVKVHDNYPSYLAKAIEIANVMLHAPEVESTFTFRLGANNVTKKHLHDVEVRFRKPEKAIYGWTDRSEEAKEIFVNEVLRDRIIRINQDDNSHEYRCIVFMIAVVILHECAHLTLRWKGTLDSPEKFDAEVGNYIENKLFNGLTRLKVKKTTSAISRTRNTGRWTSNMEIMDVVVHKVEGMRDVKRDHLKKFFTKGNLMEKNLFPVELKSYKRIKGATAHLGSNLKGKRHCTIESEVMIPSPLCGIAPHKLSF